MTCTKRQEPVVDREGSWKQCSLRCRALAAASPADHQSVPYNVATYTEPVYAID